MSEQVEASVERPFWASRSALLERRTAYGRLTPRCECSLRDGVRPVQAGDASEQRSGRVRHAEIEAARIRAHDVAANVAPGDEQGTRRAVDVPVPAERDVRHAGAAGSLPLGVAGAARVDAFGAQFREQAVIEGGIDMDELERRDCALLYADIPVDVLAGQRGGRVSHAPDCSSLPQPWDLATMTALCPVFLIC